MKTGISLLCQCYKTFISLSPILGQIRQKVFPPASFFIPVLHLRTDYSVYQQINIRLNSNCLVGTKKPCPDLSKSFRDEEKSFITDTLLLSSSRPSAGLKNCWWWWTAGSDGKVSKFWLVSKADSNFWCQCNHFFPATDAAKKAEVYARG